MNSTFRALRGVCAALALMLPWSALAAENVLLVGGAGNAGVAIAKILIARGDKVTVFVRPTTDRSKLAGLPVEFVVGDAMIESEVEAALRGKRFSVILETLQILKITEKQSYARAYANFAKVAKQMGTKQFLAVGASCADRPRKDCPLSDVLYALKDDHERAEHVLRESGVPYTIFRIGALMPGDINHPDAGLRSGTSYLSEDLTKFGGVLRADFNEQMAGCVGAERCINKIFVLDDPTVRRQLEHWLCKRRMDTDKIILSHPECGEMPPIVVIKYLGQ